VIELLPGLAMTVAYSYTVALAEDSPEKNAVAPVRAQSMGVGAEE
jgi:hypothetical protein